MLKHYIEVLYPGVFSAESNVIEVRDRDLNVNLPVGACGFRFKDREEIKTEDDILKGEFKNVSGWYYLGRKYTLSEVKRNFPDKRILIENMECNDWNAVVEIRNGQVYPLYEQDTVIE